MKLFQQMLVATASLGLIAPIAAQASDVINLEGMNDYNRSKKSSSTRFDSNTFVNEVNEDLAILKGRVDGLEAQQNNFEAGSFSDTTTLDGSVVFSVGSTDTDDDFYTGAVKSNYTYTWNLNSSFTGDDNLYVGIEAGNGGTDFTGPNFRLDSTNNGDDSLKITSLYYQFPINNWEIATGTLLDNDDLMPTTTSTYSDGFFLGGYSTLSSNFYVFQGTGSGLAVARSFDNGFNFSGSVIGTGASTSSGFLTKEGIDVLTLSAGYDSDNYGGGVIYSKSDSLCNLAEQALTTFCNDFEVAALADEGYNTTSIGAYWKPDNDKTTLSITTNIVDLEAKGIDIDTIADFQFGIDHEIGNGVLSASWKTIPFYKIPDLNKAVIKGDDTGSYIEVYYTYNVNDSLQIKPGIAFAMPADDANSNTTDDVYTYLYDWTAVGVEAAFKF